MIIIPNILWEIKNVWSHQPDISDGIIIQKIMDDIGQ
jgi:hypothetical protein